jgi:hypothetical protein
MQVRIADLPDDITIPTREAFVECLTKTQNPQTRSFYRRSTDGSTCAAGDFLCVLVAMNPHQWRWVDLYQSEGQCVESCPGRPFVPIFEILNELGIDEQFVMHLNDQARETKPRIAEILEAAHKRFGHDPNPQLNVTCSTLITWYQDTYRPDYEPEWGTYSANPSELS